jgi:phage-related protein (TIGR01555 family)
MEEKDDFVNFGYGMKWGRLFGGGGVIILTDQDHEEPLDIDALANTEYLEFRDVDMWELYNLHSSTDEQERNLEVQDLDPDDDYFLYYGQKIHKSRLIIFKGRRAPSIIRPRLRGWGLSVVETFVRSINQYLKANNLSFEILDEMKIDVFKIKGLNATLAGKNVDKIKQRVRIANMEKNYNNALTMDAEDDYQQKQISFSGLADTMREIRMQVAADLRMPLTKIFGISASGFNSGADDIENYNSMIEAEIRPKAKRGLVKLVQLRCMQKFGFIPDDLKIKFKPLKTLSAEQEENVKDKKFNRAFMAVQSGEITSQEFREICNKDNLLEIELQKNIELPKKEEPEIIEEEEV